MTARLLRLSSWISGTRLSTSGDVKGPYFSTKAGLQTGARD
jgi:hypothetical protein